MKRILSKDELINIIRELKKGESKVFFLDCLEGKFIIERMRR
jgi:hypothetical protein